jgi:hypothetical protein
MSDDDEYQKAEIVIDSRAEIAALPASAERVIIVEKDIVDYVLVEHDGIAVMVPVLKADGTIGHPMYERQPPKRRLSDLQMRDLPPAAPRKLPQGDE